MDMIWWATESWKKTEHIIWKSTSSLMHKTNVLSWNWWCTAEMAEKHGNMFPQLVSLFHIRIYAGNIPTPNPRWEIWLEGIALPQILVETPFGIRSDAPWQSAPYLVPNGMGEGSSLGDHPRCAHRQWNSQCHYHALSERAYSAATAHRRTIVTTP